ncbi:MAG: ABC transporter permease [Helicobacteraceae bacterium]|jgi:NitT/TauT family transport system permease protein|nr:ABC transporter permease [Helicobacteraceae bacterium]
MIRSLWLRNLFSNGVFRKSLIIIAVAVIWQIYAVILDNSLMFPTFLASAKGFVDVICSGELIIKTGASLKMLLIAYAIGIVLALTLTVLAISSRIGSDILEVATSMLNPLAPIALLPLAMLWFGIGQSSIIFVLVHAVVWAMTLNIYNGFTGVSATLRMVGKNYELSRLGFVFYILIPAAFGSILTGLKVSWAFGWRTLIAAELVFGVSSEGGGLGWFISEKKNQLDIDLVFAGLLMVIIIGVFVENIFFKTIEKRTVIKWGAKF